ncbi:hybrid signal transduction histidine kinase M [Tanacetum coccineum]
MWAVLEKIFTDNKRLKTVELIGELRMLDIGDLTVDAYFRKIDSLALRLDNLGSNTTEDELVTYAINGLNDKYEHVAHVILNKDPFPNLEQARSILSLAESHMNRKSALSSSSRISSSSPTAFVAQASSARNHGNTSRSSIPKSTSVCHNFSRGYCSYGDRCHFVHGSNNSRGTGSLNNNHSNGYGTRNFHNNHSNGYGTCQGSAQINPATLGHGPLLEAYTQLLQTYQRLLSQSSQ